MSIKKTKYSVSKVTKINKMGKVVVVGYLSTRDEENGLDIVMDMRGYTVEAL